MVASAGRITLWGVEVFVATADEASISAAARRLGSSAATVSQQLSNLETAIGATLLNRNERPITLTQAGEMFLRRAHTILNEADQAKQELATAEYGLMRLRVGMIEDFETDVTPRLLADMAQSWGNCQFLLETGPSHRLHDMLEQRALDVIVAADVGLPSEGMEQHLLMEEPFVIAAPKGTLHSGDALADLKGLPMIRYTTRHHMGQVIATHLARHNVTETHRFELDSYHATMAMVASGAGWTILTPLALLRARRFSDQIDVGPLPLTPLSRQITLLARRGQLGEKPAEIAGRLRTLLSDMVQGPAIAAHPWLEGQLTVTQVP